jgi:hypothetical protein
MKKLITILVVHVICILIILLRDYHDKYFDKEQFDLNKEKLKSAESEYDIKFLNKLSTIFLIVMPELLLLVMIIKDVVKLFKKK